jgi:hypothetical protein
MAMEAERKSVTTKTEKFWNGLAVWNCHTPSDCTEITETVKM